MGLTIPTYSPLSAQAVLAEQEIYDAVDAALLLPVSVTGFNIWFDVTPARLASMKQTLDCWHGVGYDHIPVRDYNNNTYYLNRAQFTMVYKALCHEATIRRMNVFAKMEELLNDFDYGNVTRYDTYWKQWVEFDSNLTADINYRYSQTFAQIDTARSHEDIVVGGTDNNEPSVASGSEYRLAVLDQALYRASYWEIDVANNSGTVYVGLINRHHNKTDRVGYGADEHGFPTSYGLKIEDGVITKEVVNGVETTPTGGTVDLFQSGLETYGRCGLWLDVTSGLLRFNEGGSIDATNVFGTIVAQVSGGCSFGDWYPAVSVYDTGSVANFRVGGPNSLCDNYAPSSAYLSLETNNFAHGIYVLTLDNPIVAVTSIPETDERSYGGLTFDSDGMFLPHRSQTAHYRKIKKITSNYTVTNQDEVLLVDATLAAITISLDSVETHGNMQFQIKKTNTTGYDVTIDGNGSETIDGSATQVLTGGNMPSITVVSDPDENAWYII